MFSKPLRTWLATIFAGVLSSVPVAPASAAASPVASLDLPYHLKDGLILINGSVDGKRGVFMLDTGMPFRILLNRHYISLGKGTELKRGSVASGQALSIQSHDGTHIVALDGQARLSAAGGAAFTDPSTVLSGDFSFIEKDVDSRFLGFVGWGFLKDYRFVIDYDQPSIPLYALPLNGAPANLRLRTLPEVARIHFTPASPIVPFAIDVDGIELPAILDTGGHERLSAPPEIWTRLAASGDLVSESGATSNCFEVTHAKYKDRSLLLPELEKVIGEKTLVTLGYPFLRHYRSIWNPAEASVTLERKATVQPSAAISCD